MSTMRGDDVDVEGTAVVDRWALPHLLAGTVPPWLPRGWSFAIGEREYLRFLRAVNDCPEPLALQELVDAVSGTTGLRIRPGVLSGALFGVDQVQDLHGIGAGLLRLDVNGVAMLPEVAEHFGIGEAGAETVLLCDQHGLPFATRKSRIRPQFFKALYYYGVQILDREA